MSDLQYCDDEHCAVCDVKRHFNHLLDAGCPPEELLLIVTRVLSEVVADTINIQVVQMDELDHAGTVH